MTLIAATYGKARVRVMRLTREGDHHVPRELTLTVMMRGAFEAAWTGADNRACVATDSVKNIVNVVAAENLSLNSEDFAQAIAARFLDTYPQIAEVTVEAEETRWRRHPIDGTPHGHTFTLDGNGQPFVRLEADRDGAVLRSGLRGYTLMKTTESGWAEFVEDAFRTLPDTQDRICATSMDATWTWTAPPADPVAANAAVLDILITVFATTYSAGVQDSMYRMGEAVLAARPDIAEIQFAMPNKHYVPMNLAPFGIDHGGRIFLPTDEPHGQIEATIARTG